MRRLGPSARYMLAVIVVAASCGRTELDDCVSGTKRACHTTCGAGTQACLFGMWAPTCDVPVATRDCSGVCGPGTQQCIDDRWQACQIPVAKRACASACGPGVEICSDEMWKPCDAPQPKPPTLHATVRDFHDTHPDFERPQFGQHPDPAIVKPDLGPDDKPVYAGNPTTDTTSGAMNFNQWYNDVPGVNESTTIDLPLMVAVTATGGTAGMPVLYVYQNLFFFPIDDMLFGNEGRFHNYHFTLESHTHFNYVGGETFTFAGDDDVFVFINRKLAINLGGLHNTETGNVDLDASAAMLGIAPGGNYQLDIFFAERHTVSSTFTVRTSIADASSCR